MTHGDDTPARRTLPSMDSMGLTVPISAVAALLSAVLSAGVSWGITRRRIEEHGKRLDALEEGQDELDAHRERHALDLQAIRQDLGYTRQAVDRIESMLARLITKE